MQSINHNHDISDVADDRQQIVGLQISSDSSKYAEAIGRFTCQHQDVEYEPQHVEWFVRQAAYVYRQYTVGSDGRTR